MKKVVVFGRNISKNNKVMIKNMIEGAELKLISIIDLVIVDPQPVEYIAIALGRIAYDHVKKLSLAPNVIQLPAANKLENKQENREYRQQAWNILKNISTHKTTTEDGDWDYLIVTVANKDICIFKKKPKDIIADIYIRHDEIELLLKLKKALGIPEENPVIPYKL